MNEQNNLLTPYKEVEGIDATTYAGKAAYALKTKLRGIMGGDELLIWHLLDFVVLMDLNNKFARKGIFITADNREECYIKIIESGEENLINSLEQFITVSDKIKVIQDQKAEYTRLVEALRALKDFNDEASVNSIVEEYLRR